MTIVAAIMKVLPTGYGKRVSGVVRILVYGLKIIGLAPFSFQQSKKSSINSCDSFTASTFQFSKIGLTYNILLSILIQAFGAFAVSHLFSFNYPNKSSITQAIDVMQGVLRTSTSCILFLSWAFKQRKAASIMNRLFQVDSLLSGMRKHRSSERASFLFFTGYMILNAVTWITFWATEAVSFDSFIDWFVFNIPKFVIHWFVVEYSITLQVVVKELESLNKNLINFKELPQYLLFRTPLLNHHGRPVSSLPTHRSQLAALELLHNIRTTLSEVSQDVADFFSLPILPAVACFALTIVYNVYYLVTPVVIPISELSFSTDINTVAWISTCLHPLFLLSFNVTKTLKEAELTGLIIHKLLATTRGKEIQTELERFSLQLMHEKLDFTAYGFFSLDYTLIQSIFAATATYLVIIIQFMQSSAKTSN